MRKSWLVWLALLAVVVVIVVVLKAGGVEEPADDGAVTGKRTPSSVGFGRTTYENIAGRVATQTDAQSVDRVLGRLIRYTMSGEGWVSSVADGEEGGLIVKIDVDAPGGVSNGPEVDVYVPPDKVAGQALADGQKVGFRGSVEDIDYQDERLLVWLDKATVTPIK